MPSFGEELALRIGATQRALEADGAAPLDGTARAIRRKRAVRQGTTASVAVVAVAALAGGGAVALRRALDAQPAAYYLPPGGGEVSIPVDGPNPTIPDIGIECGDPAPEPLLENDGFRLEVSIDELDPAWRMENYQMGKATVYNDNEERFPAFVPQPDIVVVQDGVVVGLLPSGGLYSRLFFTPGRDALVNTFDVWEGGACEPLEGADFPVLAPGEYEFYVVATVENSPAIAGISRVANTYGGTPYFSEDQWLEPTDWECTHDIGWGIGADHGGGPYGSGAVACLVGQDPRAQWDPEERALVLPYSDGIVTRVFSTSLVAGPFPYTVVEPSDRGAYQYDESSPLPSDETALCGASLGWYEDARPDALYSPNLTGTQLDDDPEATGIVWTTFGPDGIEGRTASVHTPGRGRAYITAQQDQYDAAMDAWVYRAVVVGHAWVAVNDGRSVSVSRALGPASTSIVFDDLTWCGGIAPEGEVSVTVVGEQTVASENSSVTYSMYSIQPGGVIG